MKTVFVLLTTDKKDNIKWVYCAYKHEKDAIKQLKKLQKDKITGRIVLCDIN